MNILHILDHSLPIHSGYSFRSAEILAEQERLGMSITALSGPKHEQFIGLARDDVESRYIRTSFQSSLISKIPIVLHAEVVRVIANGIESALHDKKYDVIHAHSPALNGIAALRAAKKFGVPVVYEMRASWEDAAVDHGVTKSKSLRYRLSRAIETRVFRQVDAITTICDGLKREIVSRGVAECDVTVIPNAVDTQKFVEQSEDRARLRGKYGVENSFVMAFCGSFYAYEGLDTLLSVLREIRCAGVDVKLILAGGGQEEEQLKTLAEQLEIADYVQFLGRVTQDEVVSIYNLADVCVYPRRRMKLTELVTPLKPLEAMATGAVVVASDVGGHKELIEHGITGFLFESESVSSLKAVLLQLRDTPCRSTVGAAARNFVCSQRTWSSSVSRYVQVYERAVARHGQS